LTDSACHVLDACALIAVLRREPGAEAIESLLADERSLCLIHVLNLCEVAYDTLRQSPDVSLIEWVAAIEAFGLTVHWNIDAELFARAARLKAHWRRVSSADCFALALAQELNGELVTSDHHELDPLAAAGVSGNCFFR